MEWVCESRTIDDYLAVSEEIDYRHPVLANKADELYRQSPGAIEFVRAAYEFVRDQIHHSWDIQSSRVTCEASEVLQAGEGICYAKSNLLCAILRNKRIPAGFCYQRLTLGDAPESGYCIHALNAVYIDALDRWIRLDARGNKAGIDAQFSLEEERLAFPIRTHYDEIDYPVMYAQPNPGTIRTLKAHTDCMQMYLHGLPDDIL